MDKASVRILFLALIAVMFIGQAVYDFVKKNRSQAKRHLSQKSQRTSRPTATSLRQQPARKASPFIEKAEPPQPRPAETISFDDNVTAPSAHEIEDSGFSSPQEPGTPSEELRRAVIWSEILKRKF
ncbi:MAG: hypothetical protein K2K94_10420 [Muribaculaceae bacterium]|nr:hypothetical protein [Muribaculaceae bacterium]